MKTTAYRLPLLLVLLCSLSRAENESDANISTFRAIRLESNILGKIDGIFFDGETIAPLRLYQNNLKDFLIGKKGPDGKRHPQYNFEGKLYTMQELSKLETTRGSTPELKNLLRQIRSEFEQLSVQFRGIARGAKPFMATLIEESCRVRGRLNNNILCIWAHTDEQEEEQLFDDHVHTIRDLEMFFVDLHNFLGDLMHSCPRAVRQFQEKVAKFNKIKGLLPKLSISSEDQIAFLKQINPSLAKLTLDDIDLNAVRNLFNEFKNKK